MPVVRCLLVKGPEARFIGHLDLARVVERAVRRAGLPVAHSEGFNPRPRIAFASALALGATSEGEVCEITLRERVPAGEVLARLAPQMPAGLALAAAREAPPGAPSTARSLAWAAYRLAVTAGGLPEGSAEGTTGGSVDAPAGGSVDWTAVVAAFLARDECVVERMGKDGRPAPLDVRPLVRRLEVLAARAGEAELHAVVRCGGRANLRPDELARALGLVAGRPVAVRAVHRLSLYGEGSAGLRPLFEF